MLSREDIRIRDPFIFTDFKNKCYYMFGSLNLSGSYATNQTFSVFKSYDLENFENEKIIFDGKKINFWADREYWAPEVHEYNGKYYLFASFKAKDKHRASQILVSDTIDGEYYPLSNNPITPSEWDCLDGTFYVENGNPYMVFCHEWVQIGDGEICAVKLSKDLKHAVGNPFTLFKASDNKHVSELKLDTGNYVTDGPFLYRESEKLKMIWSSFCNGKYAIFEAESDSITGKWIHNQKLFDFEGGHAMIFNTLNRERKIALHTPNKTDFERLFITDF